MASYFKVNKKLIIIISILIIIFAIIIYYVIDYFLKKSQEHSFLIIGIDFGSSFSGYSILTDRKFDFEEHDKNKIFYSEIILDKETKIGKKIRKGNDNSILNIENNELYFSHFKKFLDKNYDYENAFIESDIPKGEKVKLDYVIKGFLNILVDHIEEDLEHLNLDLKEAKLIISAPSLWNDIGKNYLKKLANKARLYNTEILLEPEAVSLAIFYDKYINKKYLTTGTKYLIVDAGGYTIDVSLNEILENNNIKQLAQPKSFRLGSNFINEKIIEIINEVYGEETIKNFTKSNSIDWAKILNIIEESKNNFNSIDSDNIKLNIKLDKLICYKEKKNLFGKIYTEKKDLCYTVKNGTNITYNNEVMFIPKKLIIDIISNLSSKIVSKINEYTSVSNFNLLVLTGGFSNSLILREKIKKSFSEKDIDIEILKAPQETVMRGAAIYGVVPNQILYRISPVSILVDNYEEKKENEECEFEEKKDNENGKLKCLKYKRFIKSFELTKNGKFSEKLVYPISDKINIYYTYKNELNSDYINLLDTMEIPYSDLPLSKRNIFVGMNFSNYINVTIKDNDSKEQKSKVIYYPTQKDEDN